MSTDIPFPPPVRPTPRLKLAVNDLAIAANEWRRWWILAWTDVKQRYRRSRIGQFWLTISMAATILGIGTVFSLIMQQSIDSYFPYLGVGLIVWALISTTINELPLAFITSDIYLKSYPGPRAIVIFRTHPAQHDHLGAQFHSRSGYLDCFWHSYQLGDPALLCRTPHFCPEHGVGSAPRWNLERPFQGRTASRPQCCSARLLSHANPVPPGASPRSANGSDPLQPIREFLEILRAPLLGQVPEAHHYVMMGIFTVIGYAIAIPFYARFRERLVYWL